MKLVERPPAKVPNATNLITDEFLRRERGRIFRSYGPAVIEAMIAIEQAAGGNGNSTDSVAKYWLHRQRQRMVAIRGLRESTKTQSISHLMRQDASKADESPDHPPWDCNGLLLDLVGQPYEWVSQPYLLEIENLREILEFCDRFNLDVQIDARRAFSDPGDSIGVVYRPRIN